MSSGVHVRCADNVCRSVGDSQIEHLVRFDDCVKRVHEFFNTGRPIPPAFRSQSMSVIVHDTEAFCPKARIGG